MIRNLKVGELLYLLDADWRYGSGTLSLRVTEILDQQAEAGWVHVKGYPIAPDGRRLAERPLWVSEAALALRRTHCTP